MDTAPMPRHQGLRIPAEWEPHQATWIAWPHQRDDWPGKFAPIPWVYAEIVRHLSRSEPVRILIHSPAREREARAVLDTLPIDGRQLTFVHVPTDRTWTRDSLSPFVVDGQGRVGVVKWHFNAWAKYDNWKRDNNATGRIVKHLGRQHFRLSATRGGRPVVLEGGSIDVNGQGLLMTTEECLLSDVQQRNPGFTRQDYEEVFAEYLGIEKVLWLGRGIAGDDTHGHIDDLARFVAPNRVVTAVEDNPAEDNYRPLQENLERLRGMTDLTSRPLEVVPLPMPEPVWFAGQRLPASYANFYIANDRVLVPTFNDPHDRLALGVLAELFPGRTVVGIHAVDLVLGLGTLHCLTQQEPAGSRG
jgi:agmatine deiminase